MHHNVQNKELFYASINLQMFMNNEKNITKKKIKLKK